MIIQKFYRINTICFDSIKYDAHDTYDYISPKTNLQSYALEYYPQDEIDDEIDPLSSVVIDYLVHYQLQ